MPEHTPGPWEWEDGDDCMKLMGNVADGSHSLQILKAPKRGTPYAEYWPNEADARLIAAAPELLIACREAIALLDGETDCRPSTDVKQWRREVKAAILAAIKSAKGEIK